MTITTRREALRLAVAAGLDAGNRSMRKAGRTAWNEDDADAASDERGRVLAGLGFGDETGHPNERDGFSVGDDVVYPSHGVGRIAAIEDQVIAGRALVLFVLNFEQEKMTLRVPATKLATVGMRHLSSSTVVAEAMTTLEGKASAKRTKWSRRAQEYEDKINGGGLVAQAEVVRDLYCGGQQSYSERQLFEAALDRMCREIATVKKIDLRAAAEEILGALARARTRLGKSPPKARRLR